MYAQVIEGGTTAELRTEMDRIVTAELIPALRDEPGFAGALNLADYEGGEGLRASSGRPRPRRAARCRSTARAS